MLNAPSHWLNDTCKSKMKSKGIKSFHLKDHYLSNKAYIISSSDCHLSSTHQQQQREEINLPKEPGLFSCSIIKSFWEHEQWQYVRKHVRLLSKLIRIPLVKLNDLLDVPNVRVPGGTCLYPPCPGSGWDVLTFGSSLLYRSMTEACKHKPLITFWPRWTELQT